MGSKLRLIHLNQYFPHSCRFELRVRWSVSDGFVDISHKNDGFAMRDLVADVMKKINGVLISWIGGNVGCCQFVFLLSPHGTVSSVATDASVSLVDADDFVFGSKFDPAPSPELAGIGAGIGGVRLDVGSSEDGNSPELPSSCDRICRVMGV